MGIASTRGPDSPPSHRDVARFENRQRDINPGTRGHTRALPAHHPGPICRTNVLANDWTYPPIPPQNLHGKEGSTIRVRQRASGSTKACKQALFIFEPYTRLHPLIDLAEK